MGGSRREGTVALVVAAAVSDASQDERADVSQIRTDLCPEKADQPPAAVSFGQTSAGRARKGN